MDSPLPFLGVGVSMRELRLGTIVVPILYEDADLLLVDKPAGLPAFVAKRRLEGTLSEVVLANGIGLYDGVDAELPGVVHRLDQGTSGVMALARSRTGWIEFRRQLVTQQAKKEYAALAVGTFQEKKGRIDVPIGAKHAHGLLLRRADSSGRPSETEFEVIRSFGEQASLLRLRISTGRTHQIRVHLSYIGHPVLGDYTYGYQASQNIVVNRQMLHACALTFVVPRSRELVRVCAPLPQDMVSVLGSLARGL